MSFSVPMFQSCKAGETSSAVRVMQELLAFRGYPVKLDGNWGPATQWSLNLARGSFGRQITNPLEVYFASDHVELVRVFQFRPDTTFTVDQNIIRLCAHFLEQRFREIGGQNMGPCVRFFCDGHDGKAWQWCAAFVTETVKVSAGFFGKIYNCTDLYQKAVEKNLVVHVPIKGYIFLVPKGDGSYRHTGIVRDVAPDGKSFRTYEGNSNGEFDPEGREVTSLIRSVSGYTFVKTF